MNFGNTHKNSTPDTPLSGMMKKHETPKLDNDQFQRLTLEVEDYAFILLDTTGTITSWNRGAEIIKGYSSEEATGKSFTMFYPEEDRRSNLPGLLLQTAFQKGKAIHEGWRVRKDGTRFWGYVVITALHDEGGQVKGFLKVTRDLTERKVAEDKISNVLEELNRKNEALRRSEERYHKMVSEVRDYAIILLDADGIVLDWNKGAEMLKGYKAEEIIGKSFRVFYSKDDKENGLPERLLLEAVKKGSVTHEGWRIKKDGSRFWASIAITALHNDKGDIIGFSKVTRDLTERKKNEDRLNNIADELRHKNEILKQSEERYHKMVAEVEDYAIILLNEKGEVQNWNAGAQKIKGYRPEEILGQNFSIFYLPKDREQGLPEQLLEEAKRNGKAVYEGWRVKKNGELFWGSIVITALHDVNGHIIGFSKVTRDLTERKRAEDEIKNKALELDIKNKTLEQLNNELASFAYIASHDLKEPLRKIQIFSERLEEIDGLNDRGKAFLDKIKTSAERMQNLIGDILAYSRISNDATSHEAVNLNTILDSVKGDLEVVIADKNASIEADLLPILQGSRTQFHQLFLNLLSNALKFAKENTPPLVKITSTLVKGYDIPGVALGDFNYHHITFSDNGIGFDPQHASKIFDVFQRLHNQSEITGSGVGLAIVKKVVNNHKGLVTAEGRSGVGATFHIYLPSQ